MTLADVREPARLIAEWCLAQDDLLGFHLELREAGHMACLQVYLDWPDGWMNSRAFSRCELRLLREAPQVIVDNLEALAVQARRQAARLPDRGWLPG